MHPNTSRVNTEQNGMPASRPPPPSTPPPMPPRANTKAALQPPPTFMFNAAATPFAPKLPTLPPLEDELSTTTGSSDGEHEDDSSLSRTTSTDGSASSGRDVMLYQRSLISGVPAPPGLHCSPAAVAPPPGLSLPSRPVAVAPLGFAPPPGLESLGTHAKAPYDPKSFRKELVAIFKELAGDRNVAKAVRRVRGQGVPRDRQAAEFADAITYVLEEPRGCARRSYVAFLAGLASAFEKAECVAGLELFFQTVYLDLQEEVPKLAKIVNIELLPTLGSAFSADELRPFVALVAPRPGV